jgi:hypothetical protein
VFSQIALFFSKMAMVTFGGAYAVLAYVAQQAVEHYHWLQPREMLDGLGMAETTPGPLIMVLQFVGFMAAYRDPGTLSPMLAATLGGLLATWVTLVPCFLWIFLGAPYVETLRGNKGLAGALTAITAAVGRRNPQSCRSGSRCIRCSGRPRRFARSGCRSTCRCGRASISRPSCWRRLRRPRSSASTSGCCGCWRDRARRAWRYGCAGWLGRRNRRVGKARKRSCPPCRIRQEMVGTLALAHTYALRTHLSGASFAGSP